MPDIEATPPGVGHDPGADWAGYHIHQESTGHGPALVMTHGFGDAAGVWDAMIPTLATQYTVIRWDLLGHGQSDKPEDEAPYHPDAAVAELKRIVEDAHPPVVLVGHSVGAYLSQRFVLLYPELVRAVVLLSTGPGYRNPDAREKWNAQAQANIAHYDVPAAAWRLLEQHDSLVMDGLSDLVPPAFVVCGERDKGYVHAMGLYERKIPNVHTRIVADAGHNPQKKQGLQVAEAIHAFLERRLGAPDRGGR